MTTLEERNRDFLACFETLCRTDAELQNWYASGDHSEEMRQRIEDREARYRRAATLEESSGSGVKNTPKELGTI